MGNKTDISLALWKLLNVEDNVKQKNHQVNVVNNFGDYMRRTQGFMREKRIQFILEDKGGLLKIFWQKYEV